MSNISKVVTGKVRASYVNVFQSRLNELSGQEEYSMQLFIPKTDKKTVGRIKKAIDCAISTKWGGKNPTNLRDPLRDGDEETDLPESVTVGQEPYSDHFFMNVKSKFKPQIVDQNMNGVIDVSLLRSGDFCRVSMNAYAYDMKGNRGVAFGLQNIQVLESGEPLGNFSRPEDDFDGVSEEDYDFLGDVA